MKLGQEHSSAEARAPDGVAAIEDWTTGYVNVTPLPR